MGKQKVNCAAGTREAGLGHALLSASSSHRWLNCPPSARLCEKYEDTGSEYAQEGTDAHSLCEYKLKQALGIAAADPGTGAGGPGGEVPCRPYGRGKGAPDQARCG